MTTPPTRRRRGLLWAGIGAVVLLVGVVSIVIGSWTPPGRDTTPSTSEPTPTTHPTRPIAEESVDASVAEYGWTPEPITTDADVYVRAALAAASTFDTQLSTRPEWLAHLDSWFTPDTRYASEVDREDDMKASQLELRQGVVLPETEWNSLAQEDGRVLAATTGEVKLSDVPDDATGDMRIGTADVVVTFTRSDGNGGEISYEDTVRVSVQVLCSGDSVPTPKSSQQAGDCKVVRYFSGSVEP